MVYYIRELDTGAISYGYASPSLSHIVEHLVALEIEASTKSLADTASLHLGCYAPNWREQFLPIPHRFTPIRQS
ncbi:MAG: hypothetical protein VCF25_21885 [Candidatus Poribacteria bacterium]